MRWALVALSLLLSGPAAASDPTLTVTADQALEWHRDQSLFIARGNAQAVRGDLVVRAPVLAARYREADGGALVIETLEAQGGVRLTLPDGEAQGETGRYDIEAGVLVLRGGDLRLSSDENTVTARDSLEYHDAPGLIIARGDARLFGPRGTVTAPVLTAILEERAATGAGRGVDRVEGRGGVRIEHHAAENGTKIAEPEVATAHEGVYVIARETALLSGDVVIRQGADTLRGEMAEIDFASGQSRIFAGSQRVQGILTPGENGR